MKKTELKAKFRRYSAEEKWQHYFACKKKIRRLKKEKQELEDYSKNQGRDFAICEEMDDLKKDRDTWKRACKEACDVLRDINYKIYNEDRIDFENIFYQQVTGKLPAN